MSDSLWLHVWQQNRLPLLSLFRGVSSNSCPLSQWCHLTISSFWSLSFCSQYFPASVSLPMSWVFTSDGLSVGASASASVLPLNIALPLPKQNSCFQSPNYIEHWQGFKEQGYCPLGNPALPPCLSPSGIELLPYRFSCLKRPTNVYNCQLSRSCSFLFPQRLLPAPWLSSVHKFTGLAISC